MILFGISRSCVYDTFHTTMDIIISRIYLPGLPFDDEKAVVDFHHRFLSIQSVVCGSKHESLAFRPSSVGACMSTEGPSVGYWIHADATYM